MDRNPWLWLLGSVPVLAVAGMLLLPPERCPVGTVACFAVSSVASWAFARRVQPTVGAWRTVIGLAILVRAGALLLDPSDDIPRYLWEGKILRQGFNPYRFAPNDPSLAGLADRESVQINHPEMTAIYGPLTLIFNAVLGRVWYSTWSFKLSFLLLDLLLLRLVSTRIAACAAYGLSILPVVLISGFGHNEILWVLPCVAGVRWLSMRRFGAAALMFGVAIGFKPTAAVAALFALPWIPKRYWPLLVVTPLAAIAPFLDAGLGIVRSLAQFAFRFEYNDLWPFVVSRLLRPALSQHAADLLARLSGLLILLAVWLRMRMRRPWDAVLVGMSAWLMICPTVHPWYALSLAALGARRLDAASGWLCFGMGFYFLNYVEIHRLGTWTEIPWVRVLTYGPGLIALAVGWVASKLDRPERHTSAQPIVPSAMNPEA